MIDVIKQTPIEYSKQSRDYQVIARLYTALFNLNKMYIDNMHIWRKDIDNKLTTLRAKTLNFNPNHSWSLDALEAAVSCFKYIMFRKGTLLAVQFCITILLRINKLSANLDLDDMIIYSKNNCHLDIKIPVKLASIGIVQDLLDYILPAGITYRIKEYQTFDEYVSYTVGYSDTADITRYKFDDDRKGKPIFYDSNMLGIAESYVPEDNDDYHQGYTIERSFVNTYDKTQTIDSIYNSITQNKMYPADGDNIEENVILVANSPCSIVYHTLVIDKEEV